MTVEPGGSGTPMSERMQSLLSRAAEDQLSEQRQIAGVLTDLRAQVQRIQSDLAALREQSPNGGGSDAALSTVSADVREAVRLLGERMDGVGRLVQQRGADLGELRGLLEQVHAAINGQGDALGGLTSGLSGLPAFGDRIRGLQDNLNHLHERLSGLDALASGLGALQQRVDGVDQGLRDLRSAFAAIGARMAELPGRADLDAVGQRSSAPLGELHERIAGIEQSVAAVGGQLAAAAAQTEQGGQDEAGQRIEALRSDLAQRLAGIEQTVAAVNAQIAAVAASPDQGGDDQGGQRIEELRSDLAQFAAAARDETSGLTQGLAALDQRLTEVLDALTPEEVAEQGASEDYVEDPVLTELGELREALLGEDGLAARVEAAGSEDLDERVTAAVHQAVAASEERLTAHIDEAVLALAEALLRRRAVRPAPAAPAAASAAPAAPAPPEPVQQPLPDEPAAAEDPEPEHLAADADQLTDDDEDSAVPDAPAWQTPAGRDEAASDGAAHADADRRRRPWWRPSD
jgi:predicted  nucleic acid-binding Zn-ribbon protein